MSSGQKIGLHEAQVIASHVVQALAPSCDRIEIAGSVRRGKSEVGDIEIVCIPKRYTDLFGVDLGYCTGFVETVNRWAPIKGGAVPFWRYAQRRLPSGVNLDLFVATPENWGWIFLIRTGPGDFNVRLIYKLRDLGFTSADGVLWSGGHRVPTPEEKDVFNLIRPGLWIEPKDRK